MLRRDCTCTGTCISNRIGFLTKSRITRRCRPGDVQEGLFSIDQRTGRQRHAQRTSIKLSHKSKSRRRQFSPRSPYRYQCHGDTVIAHRTSPTPAVITFTHTQIGLHAAYTRCVLEQHLLIPGAPAGGRTGRTCVQ